MKPFNLEAALRGEKVVTREGYTVTQLVKLDGFLEIYPVVGVVEGRVRRWTEDGMYDKSADYHAFDLFMYEEPEEIWTPTNELRFEVRASIYSYKGATALRILQQKWISGTGDANEPFKVEWRDVSIVQEDPDV